MIHLRPCAGKKKRISLRDSMFREVAANMLIHGEFKMHIRLNSSLKPIECLLKTATNRMGMD